VEPPPPPQPTVIAATIPSATQASAAGIVVRDRLRPLTVLILS
jgi:hypothetical protein